MHPAELRIEDFSYELPDERIAKYPLPVRDESKLLIYKQGSISEGSYKNIATQLPDDSLLVFNQTRVVNARLLFQKPTGGIIEVFCLEPHEQYADIQTAMLQKQKVWWQCLIGGASKWKHGMVLTITQDEFVLSATIADRQPGVFTIELSWNSDISFAEVLQLTGKVPLPPYINRTAEIKDEQTYQTIFAKEEGSVAAPTAGLHFTERIFKSLEEKSIDTSYITLHVGAGTFKPVKSETMQEHDMHAEWIDVEIDFIQKLAKYEGNIIAVGTTSARTLESLYWIGAKILQHTEPNISGIAVGQWEPYQLKTEASPTHALKALADWMMQQKMNRLITRTQILIAPGYEFKIVKGLVTNFHQPQSTLLLLVSAFTGGNWKAIYEHALNNEYRFLSYGDGCLLLP